MPKAAINQYDVIVANVPDARPPRPAVPHRSGTQRCQPPPSPEAPSAEVPSGKGSSAEACGSVRNHTEPVLVPARTCFRGYLLPFGYVRVRIHFRSDLLRIRFRSVFLWIRFRSDFLRICRCSNLLRIRFCSNFLWIRVCSNCTLDFTSVHRELGAGI